MVILDTDVLTLLGRTPVGGTSRLRSRLAALPEGQIVTTVISYEEQTRGWLARIAKARTVAEQVEAYRELLGHLESYRRITVIGFDGAAATHYQMLRKERIRIGTMDMKIASIALAHDAVVVTRNLSDFRKVPGITAEDWTS